MVVMLKGTVSVTHVTLSLKSGVLNSHRNLLKVWKISSFFLLEKCLILTISFFVSKTEMRKVT